ncbi:hypothetical protein AAFF_G00356900 [Aldrovandia affinis]|uniref:Uncharacterized protein n=1 Tax=Aldrovandia affinis TaxID=143900 RepID=A0AAD7T8T6_9TELE|nr:hypothetical protein AAFF_G00356900 [Aldrovandia affinis]
MAKWESSTTSPAFQLPQWMDLKCPQDRVSVSSEDSAGLLCLCWSGPESGGTGWYCSRGHSPACDRTAGLRSWTDGTTCSSPPPGPPHRPQHSSVVCVESRSDQIPAEPRAGLRSGTDSAAYESVPAQGLQRVTISA